jgi:putative transposase
MPAPYSQDLRLRVVNAYHNKEASQRQIAQRFKVSLTALRARQEAGGRRQEERF